MKTYFPQFNEFKLNENKNSLRDEANRIEQSIWRSKNRKAEREWEEYTDDLFFDNHTKYWDDIEEFDLQNAIEYGEEILKKYKIDLIEESEELNEMFGPSNWERDWWSDIKKIEKNVKRCQEVTSDMEESELQEIAEEMEQKVLSVYDNEVAMDVIDYCLFGSPFKKETLVKLGDSIYNNYGTEQNMVVDAYQRGLYWLERKLKNLKLK